MFCQPFDENRSPNTLFPQLPNQICKSSRVSLKEWGSSLCFEETYLELACWVGERTSEKEIEVGRGLYAESQASFILRLQSAFKYSKSEEPTHWVMTRTREPDGTFYNLVSCSTTLALATSTKVAWAKMYCLSLLYYINFARYPNSLRLHLYKRNDGRVQGRPRPEPSQSYERLIVPCQLSLIPLVCKYPISFWSSSVLQIMRCFLVVNLDFVVKVPTRSPSPQLYIFQGEKSNLNQNPPVSPHGGEIALEGTVCQ